MNRCHVFFPALIKKQQKPQKTQHKKNNIFSQLHVPQPKEGKIGLWPKSWSSYSCFPMWTTSLWLIPVSSTSLAENCSGTAAQCQDALGQDASRHICFCSQTSACASSEIMMPRVEHKYMLVVGFLWRSATLEHDYYFCTRKKKWAATIGTRYMWKRTVRFGAICAYYQKMPSTRK